MAFVCSAKSCAENYIIS